MVGRIKESTILACIAALMVILISIILFTFALDNPNTPTTPSTYEMKDGIGNNDPITTPTTTWISPNSNVTYAYAVGGGGGGYGSYAWINGTPNYTMAIGGRGSYQGGTK
jgi:hypothetical protein